MWKYKKKRGGANPSANDVGSPDNQEVSETATYVVRRETKKRKRNKTSNTSDIPTDTLVDRGNEQTISEYDQEGTVTPIEHDTANDPVTPSCSNPTADASTSSVVSPIICVSLSSDIANIFKNMSPDTV